MNARARISARLRRLIPTPAQAGAWLALLTFAFVTGVALTGRDHIAEQLQTSAVAPADPTELSPEDQGLYAMIARAQTAGEWRKADALIEDLSNRGLVGYVLAERYLSGRYSPDREELQHWLAAYRDHPQATRIAGLAINRGLNIAMPKPEKPLRGEGYSDHLGRSGMPDRWFTALSHWREGDYADAGEIFEQLSAEESLGPWQRSAAYFWAARAATQRGDDDKAHAQLKQAATYPTTFYGLLAAEQLGASQLDIEAPEVSDSLREDGRAIRAALLVQLGRKDEAEDELRALYGATSAHHRTGIVTLASELSLPNLQMRLANTPGLSAAEQRFAQFPAPHYMIDLHSVMDSALLLAVARNESGFRETARNAGSGATGMMQMLPSTAQMVERRVGETLLTEANALGTSASLADRLSNPALSARYGAEYLKMLTREEAIGRNLIHMLIGYNAGPGTAASWKRAGGTVTDPLLYIESIPYAETRNYVMQVAAQYWVYQRLMDERPTTLKALANGEWPMVGAGV